MHFNGFFDKKDALSALMQAIFMSILNLFESNVNF